MSRIWDHRDRDRPEPPDIAGAAFWLGVWSAVIVWMLIKNGVIR